MSSSSPFRRLAAILRHSALAAALLLALPPSSAAAQATAEQEVRAVVDRLFDGMRAGDSTVVRSVFHPQAGLFTTTVRDGQPLMRSDSIAAFLRAVGTPHEEVWDERIANVEIRVDDPLATAWMDYRFHLGERFSHCGVNALQFFRTPEGWKIIQIIDTRRQSCPS
jgi:type II secretory pathway pseudopilin PulG